MQVRSPSRRAAHVLLLALVHLSTSTARPVPCCSPSAISGCTNPSVSTCVCAFDPFCCSEKWDKQCVEEAEDQCSLNCNECVSVHRSVFEEMEQLFDGSEGLLVHSLGQTFDIEPYFLQKGSGFSWTDELPVQFLADCGSPGKMTCSAWSLLRHDLIPVAYNYPTYGSDPDDPNMMYGMNHGISLVLNRVKAQPLVTGMRVIDGDTWSRRGCAAQGGGAQFEPGSTSNYGWRAVFSGVGLDVDTETQILKQSDNDIGPVPASCGADERCKNINAGGGIQYKYDLGAWTIMFDSMDPQFQNTEQCFQNTMGDLSMLESQGSADCLACTSPFVCIPSEPSDGIYQRYDAPTGRFLNYVGNGGDKWTDLFVLNKIDSSTTMARQCGFQKTDWTSLTSAARFMYMKAVDNPLIVADNNKPDGRTYLESEVNIYFDGENPTGAAYGEQISTLTDALMAVTYQGNTCLDLLSSMGATEAANYCYGTPTNPSVLGNTWNLEDERKIIERTRDTACELGKRLGVPVYLNQLSTNAIVDEPVWRTALEGNIKLPNYMSIATCS